MKYNEPVVGKTRLVKEIFLLKEVGKIKDMYEFKADNYGPCSDELLNDLDILIEQGLVESGDHPYGTKYSLTSKGTSMANTLISNQIKEKIENIKRNYNNMPLNKLLVYVYSAFPRYTTKSVIKERLDQFI